MIPTPEETQQEAASQGTDHPVQKRRGFINQSREEQVQALLDWLHPDLRDLPDITWETLPSRAIRYLVTTVKEAPHASQLALAVGKAHGSMGVGSLRNLATNLHGLLSSLEKHCNIGNGFQLTREVWEQYISMTESTATRRVHLNYYAAATEIYLAEYLEQVDAATREKIAPYLLPRLPARFLERLGITQKVRVEQEKRRKEKSDILVPLHSILVALIQFRKQATQRLLQAFHEAFQRAENGEPLPLSFGYEETLVEVNMGAQTVAEFCLEKKPVFFPFKLWNRCTWILQHPDAFCRTSLRNARERVGIYIPEKEIYFVEYVGDPAHFLWFGDLIQNGLLRHLSTTLPSDPQKAETHLKRLSMARFLGAPMGFSTGCPGLLTPAQQSGGGRLFQYAHDISDTLVFEPESLYRGVLYGSALATLALTNGSRLSELLQVSADRFKGHVYEEQKPGQKDRGQRVIWLQHLLPKGRRTEAERQLFPLSPQAYELLREIGSLLKATHGSIPIVAPHPENTKAEDLLPERYLFQWGVGASGQTSTIKPGDVSILIRFVLHGLEFHTKQGERFTVSTHLLRHVMATAARHEYEVPAEVVAFVLHHRQTSQAIPAATEYYAQMPEDQRLQILAEFLLDLEEEAANVLLHVPHERTLEQMDEDLRDVFERWQTLLETAFGFCGCTGLCPRGYHRSLCLGCPHLIPNPRKRESLAKWRTSYARQAKELEVEGATVDARQARLQVQECDDLLNCMDVMQQAMDDGTHKPAFLQLPSAPYDTVVVDAQA